MPTLSHPMLDDFLVNERSLQFHTKIKKLSMCAIIKNIMEKNLWPVTVSNYAEKRITNDYVQSCPPPICPYLQHLHVQSQTLFHTFEEYNLQMLKNP
jgi:hypothetical protein